MATNLIKKGNVALKNILTTVKPFNKDDWKDAYARIGFEIGKSPVTSKIQKNCIASELLTIAQGNSWYLADYQEDTYIFNGAFWVKLEKKTTCEFCERCFY